MGCCGQNDFQDDLRKILDAAKLHAEKKGEIVIVYKMNGFYNFSLSLPKGAEVVQYVSKW